MLIDKLLSKKRYFQIAISAILTFYLIYIMDWNRFILIISNSEAEFLFYIPILYGIRFFSISLRWKVILIAFKIKLKLKIIYYLYLTTSFYNCFLPGVISGDFLRIGMCSSKTKQPVSLIMSTVLVERISGLISLLLMGSFFTFYLPTYISSSLGDYLIQFLYWSTVTSILIVVTSQIFSKISIEFFNNKYKKHFLELLSKIINTFSEIPLDRLIMILFISMAYQAATIYTAFFIGKMLNIFLPVSFYFVTMPIVYILTLIPISIGGIGVRENVLIYLLSLVSVEQSQAITLAFLIYAIQMIYGLICKLITAFWKI